MNTANIFKKFSISVAPIVIGLLMIGTGTANAIPYTGDTTVASPVPAFNVFTGNLPPPAPAGGEQDFFQGRVPVVSGDLKDTHTPYADPTSTDCTDGKIIQMRVYVHNGASADANNGGNGPSVAHGTRVKVSLPTGEAANFNPNATISASNAAAVSDGLTINCNGQSVKLQYVAGSASQYSMGTGFVPLSDSIISSGVPIRSEQVAGDVWGCWNERVYVLLAVKVVKNTPPPATYTCDLFTIAADVNRKVKVTSFKTSATNGAVFTNAVVNWGDSSADTTAANIVGQTHQYTKDDTYTVTATAHFTLNGQPVTASGPNCVQQITVKTNTTTPVYTCDMFDITADVNRLVKVTRFETTAQNGAVFKNVVVDWDDSSSNTTSTNIVGQTHQLDKSKDTFTITATAHFTLNGQDVTATSAQCSKQVAFKGDTPPIVTPPPTTPGTPPVTPTSPGAPSRLVNTGPGSVAALFAVVAAAGTLAHRRFLSRRLGNQ